MLKTILVTGAAGFLGYFFCKELLKHDYQVIGLDNFFRGKRENIDSLLTYRQFIYHECDLSQDTNIASVRNLLTQHAVQIVIHLAAINGTQYFYDRPLFVLDQNIRITQTLVSALKDTSVRYLIYTSSSEVYGQPVTIPTSEEDPILLNILADRDSYAASKAIDEFYLRLLTEQQAIDCLIVRVFNLYGERMVGTRYGQVIPEFIRKLVNRETFTVIGNGSHTRSFCHVQDAAWALRQLMEKNATGIINLGNDQEISILQLAQMIHRLANKPFKPKFLPNRPKDIIRRCPNIQRLKTQLPQLRFTPLEQGLSQLLNKYIRS